MFFIDVQRRLVSWERGVRRADLIEIWPVIRVSIERLILSEILGNNGKGPGSSYFNAFTSTKLFRLIGVCAMPGAPTGDSRVIFALPERLANRGSNSWNPYFGWIDHALDSTLCTRYQIGNVKSWRELIRLLFADLSPALWGLFLILPHLRSIFCAIRDITGKSVIWTLKGTIMVFLRLWCFKIYVSRFDRYVKFKTGQLVITTAFKDVAMMALVSSAHKAGADVAEVQHGLFYEGDFGYTPWSQFSESSCLPSRYIAWNEADADHAIRAFGLSREQVVVTGLLTAHPETVDRLTRGRATNDSSASCLLVLQPSQYMTPREMSNIVSQVVADGRQLDIRVHPDGRDSVYLRELKRHLSREILNKTEVVDSNQISAHEHILRSGCVIGEASSMVLEAAHLGVPAALIGSVVRELATYSAIPDRLIISSDGESITKFLNKKDFLPDTQYLPNKKELKRINKLMRSFEK